MKRLFLGLALLLTSLTVAASNQSSSHWNHHKQTVVSAAKKSGASPRLATAVMFNESRGNARAKNPHSSAQGLMGLTRPTARAMLRKYGKELGLARNADITNPKVNALLGTVYLKDVRQEMTTRLGRPATDTEAYLAYHFSPAKAERMIKARPSKRMVDVYPAAAKGNRPWFYHKGGKAKTVSEAIAMARSKIDNASKYGHEAVAVAKAPKPKASSKLLASLSTAMPLCMSDIDADESEHREHPLMNKGKLGTSEISRCRDTNVRDPEFDTAMVRYSLKDRYLRY